jgi:PAS domain S-box-containing protein
VNPPLAESGFLFPPEWIKAGLILNLLTVWVVVTLFAYLDRRTRQPYFRYWVVAWLFYSVHLAASIGLEESPHLPALVMARRACIGISALFMLWGSFQFTPRRRSQSELAGAVVFILLWSYVAAFRVAATWWITVPGFVLLALACGYTGLNYRRYRAQYAGGRVLGLGFVLWGAHLMVFPFVEGSPVLMAVAYLLSAALAVLLIIGMVVEEESSISERHYETLFNSSREAIFLLDPQSLRVLEANRVAQRLTGGAPLELAGRSLLDLCPELRSDPPPTGIATVRNLLASRPGRELELVGAGGRQILCEASVSLADCPRGPVVQLSLSDMTERKELQERLLHAQKMEVAGRLASGLAHDFKNIIAGVLAFVEYGLSKTTAGQPAHKAFEQIEQSAARAAALTSQMLAFSRKQSLQPQDVDLNKLVERSVEMLRQVLGAETKLVTQLAETPVDVRADPAQLDQVLLNLAINARDAMPEGGTVTIATRHLKDNQVCLLVTDTGAGMSAEVKAHLFEPFFTTKPAGKGTGLGLAACDGIIQQSGGFIAVDSEVGRGTTFRVYLPRAV